MGGPCRLILKKEATTEKEAGCCLPGPLFRATAAPPCTDNFQVRPFVFDGMEWHSVEQCYQAMKFVSPGAREKVHLVKPFPGESDHAHGMRVWRAGQQGTVRPDWDAVKVERAVLAGWLAGCDSSYRGGHAPPRGPHCEFRKW